MLENITSGAIKNMSLDELTSLCDEIRDRIIATVMVNGGHLASNLGMVELTVAMHYVFDFPKDKVVFDVGHQCYAHKLLSGRADRFDTLRKRGGLSGFPKADESEYDCYNTGHAGTSVSAALGIAKARDIQGEDFSVMAVIGDGSFNNGLIYEAFNSLRLINSNILVILNDNGMSISPTVGSMHEYLEILAADENHKDKLERHSRAFENFGFIYDGVYNGNDLSCMIEKLKDAKEKLKTGSVILHVTTLKGKGYEFCEENPEATHGIQPKGTKDICEDYSSVFGDEMISLAEKNKKIVCVTAAMTASLGLGKFFECFPDRSIDVGICEENATVLCAAMASQGLKPYYAVYSTFLQRSIDEIIVDICSQNLPVTLCVDRAGVSGPDGETHQGVFDLSFLNYIPNLTIAVPKDIEEFREILRCSATYDKPLAIRYPHLARYIFPTESKFKFGKWERICEGDKYVIIACGERALAVSFMAAQKLEAEGINLGIINASFVKPLDEECLNCLNEKYIITVEDNMLLGGFGSMIDTYFSESDKKIKNIAYKDSFIPHGTVGELMSEFGLNSEEIIKFIAGNENR